MNETELLTRWNEDISGKRTGVYLAYPASPLETYLGVSTDGAPILQLISTERIESLGLGAVVDVWCAPAPRNSWLTTIALRDNRFEDAFKHICLHLAGRAAVSRDASSALLAVRHSLEELREVLLPKPLSRLSSEQLRGLVGELWYLLNVAIPAHGCDAAVLAWRGPFGAAQDFIFADDLCSEVKTLGPASTSIRISSAEQLDQEGLRLEVLCISEVSSDQPGCLSVASLVSAIALACSGSGFHEREMSKRLVRLGVDLSDDFYSQSCFSLKSWRTFLVNRDFPRIRRSLLQAQIDSVRYSLNVEHLSEFIIQSQSYTDGNI